MSGVENDDVEAPEACVIGVSFGNSNSSIAYTATVWSHQVQACQSAMLMIFRMARQK